MTFIIAEAGINHCGSLLMALDMVDVAKEAGADAVKFQLFLPESMPAASRHVLRGLCLSYSKMRIVAERCDRVGIEFMCTAFCLDTLQEVERLGVKRIKIGSGQVMDKKFVSAVGEIGLPVIMSNGLVSMSVLADAVDILDTHRIDPTILYCVSKYPAADSEVDFSHVRILRNYFGYRDVGYSDHTRTIGWCVAAAATGADVIEKHFTLSRKLDGPDQICSAEPKELRSMVLHIRNPRI
tara:strand:+ start:4520 stop:5236 length:717 start_codon:yes stop_codon:yes gene_type:complete